MKDSLQLNTTYNVEVSFAFPLYVNRNEDN